MDIEEEWYLESVMQYENYSSCNIHVWRNFSKANIENFIGKINDILIILLKTLNVDTC